MVRGSRTSRRQEFRWCRLPRRTRACSSPGRPRSSNVSKGCRSRTPHSPPEVAPFEANRRSPQPAWKAARSTRWVPNFEVDMGLRSTCNPTSTPMHWWPVSSIAAGRRTPCRPGSGKADSARSTSPSFATPPATGCRPSRRRSPTSPRPCRSRSTAWPQSIAPSRPPAASPSMRSTTPACSSTGPAPGWRARWSHGTPRPAVT